MATQDDSTNQDRDTGGKRDDKAIEDKLEEVRATMWKADGLLGIAERGGFEDDSEMDALLEVTRPLLGTACQAIDDALELLGADTEKPANADRPQLTLRSYQIPCEGKNVEQCIREIARHGWTVSSYEEEGAQHYAIERRYYNELGVKYFLAERELLNDLEEQPEPAKEPRSRNDDAATVADVAFDKFQVRCDKMPTDQVAFELRRHLWETHEIIAADQTEDEYMVSGKFSLKGLQNFLAERKFIESLLPAE
jgi:hypothetical protein